MTLDVTVTRFETRPALAAALGSAVAARLAEAIAANGRAMLAVSGGSTPKLFFQALAQEDIDWTQVLVTLVDERFVDENSPRSNAALAKANLLRGRAAAARFVGLYQPASTVEAAADKADAVRRSLGGPADVLVLGMGNDGHTASFFPDATTLPDLLDAGSERLVAPVHALSAGEPRLTMTLPSVAASRSVFLHIEGEEKRAVLDSALAGAKLPIGAVLSALPRPAAVYWAP